MSAEVRTLGGSKFNPDEPVKEVIDLCEDMLKAAKDGQLRALAIAGVLKNNAVTTGASIDSYTSAHLAGAISVLQYEFLGRHYNPSCKR